MQILDVTVLDGNYAVDFKFSGFEVKNIISKFLKLGIKYIEIGHRMGVIFLTIFNDK